MREGSIQPRWSAVVGNRKASDTCITTNDPDYFEEGDVLMISETGEFIRIVEHQDYGRMLVIRGMNCSPREIRDGAEIVLVGWADRVR